LPSSHDNAFTLKNEDFMLPTMAVKRTEATRVHLKQSHRKVLGSHLLGNEPSHLYAFTCTISISAFPANITVGDSIILNGSISPVRVEANVTINYRLLGETWNTLKTLVTDADAHYSYNWTPVTTGTYEVKASWEGDLTHLPDESDVQTVTVEETERPTTNIYLYIAAAAVIIIITTAVLYVMRTRKRKPPSIKENG
jgi:hypothetical protein